MLHFLYFRKTKKTKYNSTAIFQYSSCTDRTSRTKEIHRMFIKTDDTLCPEENPTKFLEKPCTNYIINHQAKKLQVRKNNKLKTKERVDKFQI